MLCFAISSLALITLNDKIPFVVKPQKKKINQPRLGKKKKESINHSKSLAQCPGSNKSWIKGQNSARKGSPAIPGLFFSHGISQFKTISWCQVSPKNAACDTLLLNGHFGNRMIIYTTEYNILFRGIYASRLLFLCY